MHLIQLRLRLLEFDYQIQRRPGCFQEVRDALTRHLQNERSEYEGVNDDIRV